MEEPPLLPDRKPREWRIGTGMLAANGAALVVIGLSLAVAQDSRYRAAMIGLWGLPFLMGLVGAWVWSPLKLRIGTTLLYSLYTTLIGLAGAAIVFHEGVICLLMASPLILIFLAAGALVGRAVFGRNSNDRMKVSVLPLLGVILAAEPGFRESNLAVMTDEITIAARPEQVWPHVLAFSEIPEPPRYWLFRIGLPYPTATTNGGNFVGADRACEFSGGVVFEEKVAVIEPNRRLAFDIVKMPPDPELMGHIDTTRGEFELRDNGDGTTTLIGRSWYRLHVRPLWYFDWWTRDMGRAVHLRVMRNVKRLAEEAA